MAIEHDGGAKALVATRVIATWPAGTFLENLAMLADGGIAVSVHSEQAIDRVDPRTGAVRRLATASVPLAGLAVAADGTIWASGGIPGTAGGSIWRLAPGDTTEKWLDLPEALFLNGMTWAPDGVTLLVAESLAGCVYAVSTSRPSATVWLTDDLLRPATMGATPGANGIKLCRGAAIVSVTDRNVLLRIPLDEAGGAGRPTVLAERLRADDFAVAEDGSLFIATHPADSVVRLSPDGGRITLADAAQGAVNPTASAFGTGDDGTGLYVTTTGGIVAPPPGGLQPARLLRLEVGVGVGVGGA